MIYQINGLKSKHYKFNGHLLYVLHWVKKNEWMNEWMKNKVRIKWEQGNKGYMAFFLREEWEISLTFIINACIVWKEICSNIKIISRSSIKVCFVNFG